MRRKNVFGWLLGLLLVSGCEKKEEVAKAVAFREDGVLELKLMTLNLRYENGEDMGARAWRERVVAIVAGIREMDPDVFGIQEGLHGQVADLRASLPDYSFAGIGRDDGKRAGEYTGLFFKKIRFEMDAESSGTFWLSDTPNVPGSMTWGNKFPRVANRAQLVDRVSGRAFQVVNLHLDHRSQKSKERGVRLIAEKLVEMDSSGVPVVVLGDFNATETNEVLKFLGGKKSSIPGVKGFPGLVETYGKFHGGRRSKGSVNFWKSNPELDWKLDHIFVSRNAEVLGAEVMRHAEPYLSDHFPVVAKVRWK